MTTTAAAPSEICDAEPAVIVPSLANAGRSRPSDSTVVSARTPSSSLNSIGVALALRDRDRDDLVVEQAVLGRARSQLVRPRRELVLLLAGEVVASVVVLGGQAHRDLVDGAEQRVVGHRVHHRPVAVLDALAAADQDVRGVGHRLHATGDHDVELAGADQLVGQGDRIEPGQADLVDGQRRHVQGDATGDRRLPGGDLAGTGLDDVAHDHVVHLIGTTPALSRAPLMAMPPRSAAEKPFSEPRSRPIGVRAPATITDPDMVCLSRRGLARLAQGHDIHARGEGEHRLPGVRRPTPPAGHPHAARAPRPQMPPAAGIAHGVG